MRPIDADKIDYRETVVGEAEFATYHTVAFKSDIEALPTVDIKTEVAREIFDEVIDKISFRYLNDIDYSFGDMIYDLNELKNKYTKEGVGE